MTQHRPSAVVALLSAVAVLTAGAAGPSPPDSPHAFLRARAAFSEAELVALGRGQPITKSLPAKDTHEVAVLGAVIIQAETQDFLEAYRDIVAFKRGDMLGHYDDRRPPVSLAGELTPLLGPSPYAIECVPEF